MFVDVNGVRLWTEVTGDGPPLILCHGGPGLPDYLESLAAMLPACVHRFEQRGCGRSENKEPIDLPTLVADMEALRAHWQIDRAIVAGHSWGASLALRYAHDHPDRCTALLLLNGLGAEDGWQAEFQAEAARRAGERRGLLTADRVLDAWLDGPLRNLHAFALRPDLHARLWDEYHAWTESFHGVATRTLLVHGTDDPRPGGPARNLAARLPDARLVELDGAGHFPWLSHEDAFAAAVLPFLESAGQ